VHAQQFIAQSWYVVHDAPDWPASLPNGFCVVHAHDDPDVFCATTYVKPPDDASDPLVGNEAHADEPLDPLLDPPLLEPPLLEPLVVPLLDPPLEPPLDVVPPLVDG